MRARRSSPWAIALSVPALLACGDPSDAALAAYDVHLAADGCTLAAADEIVVSVFDEAGEPVDEIVAQLDGTPPEAVFPTGVRVAAGSESSAGFRVVAEMRASGEPINRVSARAEYVPGEVEELRLLFDDACLGIECGGDRTCIGGSCASDVMPPPATPHGMRAVCPPIVYVDSSDGADTGTCGARDEPCASVEHAIVLHSTAANGAIVNVHGGRTYTNDATDLVAIRAAQGGSSSAPLVIRAWPGTGVPKLDARSVNAKVISVRAVNVVLQGLEITGGVEHGISINGPENQFITIRDCVAHGNGSGPSGFDNRAGINTNNGASDILIERCELRDNRSAVAGEAAGLHVNLGARIVLRDSILAGNDRGLHSDASGEVTIEGNTFASNGSRGLSIDGGIVSIRGNRVCGHDEGIVITAGESPVGVEGNSVVAATVTGIRISMRPAVVRGNIVAFVSGTAIAVDAADVEDSHNLYFGNGADFEGLTPDQPATDVFADPLFVDRATCDLDVTEGSPALGAGPTGGPIGAL